MNDGLMFGLACAVAYLGGYVVALLVSRIGTTKLVVGGVTYRVPTAMKHELEHWIREYGVLRDVAKTWKCEFENAREFGLVLLQKTERQKKYIKSLFALVGELKAKQVRYYVCADRHFNRLNHQTKCLFERYPEDDGVCIFDPGERVRRLESAIRAAERCLRGSESVGLLHYMGLGYGELDAMDKVTIASVLAEQEKQ